MGGPSLETSRSAATGGVKYRFQVFHAGAGQPVIGAYSSLIQHCLEDGAYAIDASQIIGLGALFKLFRRLIGVTHDRALRQLVRLLRRGFGRFRLTGFFLSRRYSHTVVVRDEKEKRIIEIFPAFPAHIATKIARGECEK